jgi:hypothetical protein
MIYPDQIIFKPIQKYEIHSGKKVALNGKIGYTPINYMNQTTGTNTTRSVIWDSAERTRTKNG